MERLSVLLLFSGFNPLVLSIPRKFYLSQQLKTWTDAQTYCRTNYSDLASINTNDDLIKLQNEALKYQFTSSAWIGLFLRLNTWRWSYMSESLTFINWYTTSVPPQPDNAKGVELCGVYNPTVTPPAWFDMQCAKMYPYVCYDARYTGASRYIYYLNPTSWSSAQTYCKQYHTDFAIVRTATDDADMQTALTSLTSAAWIGLIRNGWRWSDGLSTSKAVPWATGQPDNAKFYETCSYINSGQASDTLCTDLNPFFCYRFITGQQQIIRLKVQSNQDVNDPAVMSTILEMMKQKLVGLGVTGNITVTWRKPPDGVFHKLIPPQAITTNSKCDINLF